MTKWFSTNSRMLFCVLRLMVQLVTFMCNCPDMNIVTKMYCGITGTPSKASVAQATFQPGEYCEHWLDKLQKHCRWTNVCLPTPIENGYWKSH